MKYPPIGYNEYLQMDALLGAQKLRSVDFKNPAHDEMLFIIVHQTYELWFKQILFEVDSVIEIFKLNPMPENSLGLALHRLERVKSIFQLISGQIDVLETMTPLDFLEFRDYLYPASGFQSFQFRLLETKLGLKEADRLNYNEGPFYKYLTPQQQDEIKELLKQPSLFELMDQWLARTPYLRDETFCFWTAYQETVEKMFAEDMKVIEENPLLNPEAKVRNLQMMKSSLETFKALFNEKEYMELQKRGIFKLSYPALHGALLIQLYRDQAILQTPFKIIKTLMDIDELITQWRYRHSLMAHRMLGTKIGTGGSSGHQYLKDSTEKHKLFSDFFNLSTFFIPRNQLPKLPKELTKKMDFPEYPFPR